MNKFSSGIFLDIFYDDRLDLQRKIDFIKNIPGLRHIEILIETILSLDTILWLKDQLSGYKIIVHGPFTGLCLISGHNEIRQTTLNIYKKYIDLSVTLGAKLITIHTGKYPVYFNPQIATDLFLKNFSELISYANNKIILTTENMPGKKGAQIDFPSLLELEKIYKNLPKTTFTLDVGHCLETGEDFYSFILKYKNQIKNIHLHNAVKNGKSHYGLQHLGDLDTKKFINFLNEINYQEFLTIEVLSNEDKIESAKLIQS